MAITKKHMEVQEKKAALVNDAAEIIEQLKEAAQKIPKQVIEGDARLACEWRDKAESAFHGAKIPPTSLSLSELAGRVTGLNNTLSFLRNPR